MVKIPKRAVSKDWYWPLGSLGYSPEIRDTFPEEAEMVGVITIMWNRIEQGLRHLFMEILEPRTATYGEAIWDRQPTHQARRDLLSVALETANLSERQSAILSYIIEKTKGMADRRNELIHAEYVVHGRTDKLHAKVKSPRSTKPAKFQKLSTKDLQTVIDGLDELFGVIEGAFFEFLGPEARKKHDSIMRELESLRPSVQNPQID